MSAERSHVQWGHTAIAYAIQRSDRRATVSLAVEPTGRVVLTAPRAVPIERLDRVVRAKAAWIVDRVNRRREMPSVTAREFVSGETFRYLGRQYRLRVARGNDVGVRLVDGRLVVTLGENSDGVGRADAVRTALVGWYRRHAQRWFAVLLADWAPRVGVAVPHLLVRDQHRRWGSCDQNAIVRLNWRILQAPTRLVEYVVAHELVHLRHADHTRAFWAALGRAMPDCDRRRDELRQVGISFEW